MQHVGSYTYCNEFINNSVSTTGKATLEQLMAEKITDPRVLKNFMDSVRFIYKFILDSVSEDVIKAIINKAAPGSMDEDRSDILVFLAIITVLFGDSRYIIKSWSSILDLNDASEEQLKNIAAICSYNWLDILNASSTLTEQQRSAMRIASEVMRYKGSFDGFLSCIRNNAFGIIDDDESVADITKIRIREDYQVLDGHQTRVVIIQSPYTQFLPKYDEQGDPTLQYDSMSIYQRALLDKLEELRPAGVFIYYQIDEVGLKKMSYFYHIYESGGSQSYKPGTFPRDQLANSINPNGTFNWSSIVDTISVLIEGQMVRYKDAYTTFRGLPMGMYFSAVIYLAQCAFTPYTFTDLDFASDGRTENVYLPIDYVEEQGGHETSTTGTVTSYEDAD